VIESLHPLSGNRSKAVSLLNDTQVSRLTGMGTVSYALRREHRIDHQASTRANAAHFGSRSIGNKVQVGQIAYLTFCVAVAVAVEIYFDAKFPVTTISLLTKSVMSREVESGTFTLFRFGRRTYLVFR
jgi:hypothetical protein